jgi:hypothetical protein
MKTTKHKLEVLAFAALAMTLVTRPAMAQMSSHASTGVMASSSPNGSSLPPAAMTPMMQISDKPVVRINGTELTDRDLLREMLTIFPYARQHNGFPKAEEPKIRMGALRMIEFEELVYQEALRRGMTIPPVKLAKAEKDFRAQFPSQEVFDGFMKEEMHGSRAALRKQISRSLLIEQMLKLEVKDKSVVTLAETRAYYLKNPKEFGYQEKFEIQTISIMPPAKATEQAKQEAKKQAEEAWKQAKVTNSYQDFGLLAEKLSQDDFHVNMGDHHAVDADKLPPEIVKAAKAMKPGQISDLLQLGEFYTFFRLNVDKPAGKFTYEQVKEPLRQRLQQEKSEQLRARLDMKLRQNAKVQEL